MDLICSMTGGGRMFDMFGNERTPEEELEKHRGDKGYLERFFMNNNKTYEEVAVGKYHVIRTIHGITGEPSYFVYSPESYVKYKSWRPKE